MAFGCSAVIPRRASPPTGGQLPVDDGDQGDAHLRNGFRVLGVGTLQHRPHGDQRMAAYRRVLTRPVHASRGRCASDRHTEQRGGIDANEDGFTGLEGLVIDDLTRVEADHDLIDFLEATARILSL
jgi:hypothetical protein